MRRKSGMLLLALASLYGLVSGIHASRVSAVASSGNLQDATSRDPAIPKWEYCAIADVDAYGASDKAVGIAVIYYFRGSGYQAEKVEATAERGVDATRVAVDMARAKAIAKLGDDGWEMLCEGMPFATRARPAERDKALYFRRAKR
jgi:hypothetical protein